jgi:putative hydrolase of the HAD superfamily
MLAEPVIMLPYVEDTLEALSKRYGLVMATKGDILDQERKIQKSGLSKYLHHIEIMSEKTTQGYRKLIKSLAIEPSEFIMVGNSLKSDVLPVLEIGASAVHIPFCDTWECETVSGEVKHENLVKAKAISDLLKFL